MPAKNLKTAPQGCFWVGQVLYGRTRVAGKLYRWSLDTDDPKIAAERRRKGKDGVVAIRRADAHSFATVIENWATEWLEPNKGPKTTQRYLLSIKQLVPFLEGKKLAEIDGPLVASIIKARRAKGITNATIKRDLVALSSVFNFAIDQGLREDNPVLPRMKRVEEKHHPIVLPTDADIAQVIELAPGMVKDLMRLALATGAREDELLSATWDQVDKARRQMTLIGKGRKGVKKHRVIDLKPFDGYKVLDRVAVHPKSSVLFWHSKGLAYHGFPQQFAKLRKRVERIAKEEGRSFRPFRFHDLRHVHAVKWLKDGRSIYDLQRRLGHASIKTTEIYCAFLTPEEDRIVKGLAA
jgi:integrase/recombinase XerD